MRLIAIAASIFALIFLAIQSLPRRATTFLPGSATLDSAQERVGDGTEDFAISIQMQHSPYSWEDMYPWDHVAEPYRKAVMKVTDNKYLNDEDVKFR